MYTGRDYSDISFAQKVEIALKSALTIKELHDRNIIHADIKPENFMFNLEDDVVTVSAVDFGFSKKLEDVERAITEDSIAGTVLYMSPEIIYEKTYSKASDVYALGMMLKRDLQWRGYSDDSDVKVVIDLARSMVDRKPENRPDIEKVVSTLQKVNQFLLVTKFLPIIVNLSNVIVGVLRRVIRNCSTI